MKDTTMSNVDMFNYYASQLNLSKPQLEAVTSCFKACLEADEGEPVGNEQPEQTAPSQDRKQNASFQDDNMFAEQSMKEEQRERIRRWQTFLNKQLGANLDVDGTWGPKTAAAYQQYLTSKNNQA